MSLLELAIVKVSENPQYPEVFDSQAYYDSECIYIQRWFNRMMIKRQIYFMRLCKLYYFCLLSDIRYEVYHKVDLEELSHWQLTRWVACELVFGFYHKTMDNKDRAINRIRMEIPFEHSYGRALEYTLENFEKALEEHCPNLNGNVHDWQKVMEHVPKKILMYEDFFG